MGQMGGELARVGFQMGFHSAKLQSELANKAARIMELEVRNCAGRVDSTESTGQKEEEWHAAGS